MTTALHNVENAEGALGRILYMEDDPGLARLLKNQLSRHGYLVDLAPDGTTGLDKIAQQEYDAVLVDYEMPVMGGMEVVAHLVENAPLLPVIMVTGNGNEEVAVEAMKLGASDYLVKDLDLRYLELLPMVLDKVLVARRLARERERMLLALKESEERYRKLVELSPDGIVICCHSRIEFANPAALRLLGAEDPAPLVGNLLTRFVHPDSADLFQAQLEMIETVGGNVPWLEERFIRLDGTELPVEVSGVPFGYRGRPAVQIIFRDVSSRMEAKQLLEHMAYYDQLTQLPNRVLFFDRLAMQLAQAKRYDFQFALLYLDLDGFKGVNDTLGHDRGDRLLVQVAERLQGCLRVSDTVCRMGGDEFVILTARVKGPEDAAVVAGKLIEALQVPFELGEENRGIGGSVGVAIFPSDAEDADSLVLQADRAMYRAKQDGGNCFRYALQAEAKD